MFKNPNIPSFADTAITYLYTKLKMNALGIIK